MKTKTETTKVKGFITENHSEEIAETFGKEFADKVAAAKEGETFLSMVFAGFADK